MKSIYLAAAVFFATPAIPATIYRCDTPTGVSLQDHPCGSAPRVHQSNTRDPQPGSIRTGRPLVDAAANGFAQAPGVLLHSLTEAVGHMALSIAEPQPKQPPPPKNPP